MQNDNQDKELLAIFLEEASDLIVALSKTLELWKKDEHLSWMADLKRDLHTLKGGARMLHQGAIANLAHETEGLCEALRTEMLPVDEVSKSLLLLSIDNLGAMIAALKQGAPLISAQDLIQKIQKRTLKEVMPSPMIESKTEQKQIAAIIEDVVRVRAGILEKLNTLSIENNMVGGHIAKEAAFLKNAVIEIKKTVQHLNAELDMLISQFYIISEQPFQGEVTQTHNNISQEDKMGLGVKLRRIKGNLLDLKNIANRLTEGHLVLDNLLLNQARNSMELQRRVSDTRLVSFDSIVPRLGRMARQISLELNKTIDFSVERREGEIDRAMLEHLISSLEHIVRNAIDHGIETPEKRRAKNKPEMGNIRISFFRIGDLAAIEIKDDGAGIDVEAVKNKAVKLGLIPDTESREEEILKCILEAGFSTRESATQISGRGIGLDVVSTAIKELGGSFSIVSEQGQGTKMTLKFPFTTSLNRILICSVKGHHYGILLSDLSNAVLVDTQVLESLISSGIPVFKHENKFYHLHSMEKLLSDEKSMVMHMNKKNVALLLFDLPEYPMAIIVDELLYRSELLVQSLGAQFKLVNECSGGVILGDGTVVLILDPGALSQKAKMKHHKEKMVFDVQSSSNKILRKKSLILVVDDSVTLRTFAKRLLERYQYNVITAEDGIDALQKLENDIPDLILSDLDMPRMGGFEFVANLKKNEKYKRIPIIIVTSRSSEACADKASTLGIQDIFEKPYHENLIERIKNILEEPNA